MGFRVRQSWVLTTAAPLTNALTLDRLPNPCLGLHYLNFEKADNNPCPISPLSSLNETTWRKVEAWCPVKRKHLILLFPPALL